MLDKPKRARLSNLQLVILNTAANRADRSALPWPKSIKTDTKERDRSVQALVKRGLLVEESASSKSRIWRRDENGVGLTLVISEKGLAALEPATNRKASSGAGNTAKAGTTTKTKPRTKASVILDLLRSTRGATLADLMQATGWQAHSIRGFLSGTVAKRLGHTVRSERPHGGERRYHVEA
ncbi:MAG: DUF3489 domain-containing protein [Hyphomicrobium sp.]